MAEQKCSPGGWTLDTLEKYLSSRIGELDKLSLERHTRARERIEAVSESLTAALAAIDKAVAKSEVADDKRYHNLNEIRGVLSENIKTLLPRTEYFTNHTALDDKINALRTVMDEKIAQTYVRIDAVHERIASTERSFGEFTSSIKGRSAGFGAVGGLVIGISIAMTAVAAIASMIIAIFHR